MDASMSVNPSTLLICKGKDCRKQKKALRLLEDTVDGKHPIREVRCQDICSPMVVGFVHCDKLVWAKKVKSTKDTAAILKAMQSSKMPKRIKSKLVKKRAGRLKD